MRFYKVLIELNNKKYGATKEDLSQYLLKNFLKTDSYIVHVDLQRNPTGVLRIFGFFSLNLIDKFKGDSRILQVIRIK